MTNHHLMNKHFFLKTSSTKPDFLICNSHLMLNTLEINSVIFFSIHDTPRRFFHKIRAQPSLDLWLFFLRVHKWRGFFRVATFYKEIISLNFPWSFWDFSFDLPFPLYLTVTLCYPLPPQTWNIIFFLFFFFEIKLFIWINTALLRGIKPFPHLRIIASNHLLPVAKYRFRVGVGKV